MFKRTLLFVVCSLMLTLAYAAVPAQAGNSDNNTTGVPVRCDDGSSFQNGVGFTVIQMRSGYTYTATAIGLNGFDPVLAVLNKNGTGLCTDDDDYAAYYDADLPSTGYVPQSRYSSQVKFNQNSNTTFADVSLVVGGLGNTSGEFILILEGMAVTEGDLYGDQFAVSINQSMINSGIPLSVYMISETDALDPLIYGTDSDLNYLTDDQGDAIYCDDAGDSSCWGDSRNLSRYYVSTEDIELSGGPADSMLFLPLDPSLDGLNFNLMMTSYQKRTLGHYVVVMHAGTSTAPLQNSGADLHA